MDLIFSIFYFLRYSFGTMETVKNLLMSWVSFRRMSDLFFSKVIFAVIFNSKPFVNFDELGKSRRKPIFVIPVKTGIQDKGTGSRFSPGRRLDPRFRGGDGSSDFLQGH